MSKQEINELKELLLQLRQEFREHKDEVEPLLELLRGAVVGRRLILWMTTTIMAVVGAYIAVKQLF